MADWRYCLSNATKTNSFSLLTCDYKTWKRYLEFESEIENQQSREKQTIWFFPCDFQYETFMAS